MIVFSNLAISGMKYIGVGQLGGEMGLVLGVGGKPKAGNTIHKEANSSAVSSVGHRNCHSQPGRWRGIRDSLTPQAALLVPISCP